jgi:hypothetical protein
MSQRTWLGEITIGVIIAIIAAILLARFGLDKPSGNNGGSNSQEQRMIVTEDNRSVRQEQSSEKSFSLTGSWQGGFLVNNYPVSDIYTFYTDGTMTEATFTQNGQQISSAYGRFNYANGQVNISFSTGTVEKASLTWIDPNQFHYRIIDHTDRRQIGLEIIYKRFVR